MHPAYEMETNVRAYLNGKLSLSHLREWFSPNLGILLSLEPGARPLELATALELALIEMDSARGDFTQRHLRRELRRALDRTFTVVTDGDSMTSSGNDTQSAQAGSLGESGTVVRQLQWIPTGR